MVGAVGRRSRWRRGAGPRGFGLAALLVLVAVFNIGVAVTLPLWDQIVRREKEKELLFRGIQYAEAIRVFQKRFGRSPMRLEELLEVKPRCIRQLWKDPMTRDGEWELILAEAGGEELPGSGSAPGQAAPGAATTGGRKGGRAARGRGDRRRRGQPAPGLGGATTTAGTAFIEGVRSRSEEESAMVFFGQRRYDRWLFTPAILPTLIGPDGKPRLPRLGSQRLGKPFPKDLGAVGGSAPAPGAFGSAPGGRGGTGQ